MKESFLFTSESVCEGHPDKVADQISDAILDAIIKDDKNCRVACETLLTRGIVFVAGEITTTAYADIPEIVREVAEDVGYTDASYGFDYHSCGIITSIHTQSPDIAMGVNKGHGVLGAGDQGMMFGYATDETPEYMPATIAYAHKIAKRLAEVRKKGILPYLRPDGKCQVSIRYLNHKPEKVTAVVVSAQHSPKIEMEKLRKDILEYVIEYIIPKDRWDENIKIYINPTGRFVVGGPQADTGLTGRKIIVDTYGGVGSHGGGCFSGKDPTKVDRCGSYMARYVAKNIVAAGLAKSCEVQIAYAIGVAEPVSLMLHTYGTGIMPKEEIRKLILSTYDLTPAGIIKKLDLLRPIYRKTAVYGHFGRDDEDFTWEKTDTAEILRKKAGI
ncbi:MAG: methionine adenosyltransferase [Deltaproteobacteria bacterium]|nr:methionine adenosyltransferase [Deltaproteobacteria bacterium]